MHARGWAPPGHAATVIIIMHLRFPQRLGIETAWVLPPACAMSTKGVQQRPDARRMRKALLVKAFSILVERCCSLSAVDPSG